MPVLRGLTPIQERNQIIRERSSVRRRAIMMAEKGFLKSTEKKAARQAGKAFDELFDTSRQAFYDGRDPETGYIRLKSRTGGTVLAKGESVFGTSQGTVTQHTTVRSSSQNFTDFR